MKAVNIKAPGSSDQLEIIEEKIPTPKRDQVLIKIKAAGVNRPDILQRLGLYKPPDDASPILGLEISGEIVATGKQVPVDLVGQAVLALTHGGGYAEYCAVNYQHCLPIPSNLDFYQAACLPETTFTVYFNLFQIGGLKAGDKVLIHGGSGGIGSAAIQMAKLAGAEIVAATAGSEQHCNFCRELGADYVFDYRRESFFDKIKESDISGFDIILDILGGSSFEHNLSLLNRRGRHISIAYLTGQNVKLDIGKLMTHQIIVTGSTLRPQNSVVKSSIANGVKNFLWPHIESEKFKIYVDRKFELSDVKNAHNYMESREHNGKICLIIDKT